MAATAATTTPAKAGAPAPAPVAKAEANASTDATPSPPPPERQGPAGSAATAATATEIPAEPEPAFTEVDYETYGKLHQIKHVLERWEISGINRKLQLKPRKWEEVDASSLPPEPPPQQAKHRDKKAKYSSANGAGKAGPASAAGGPGGSIIKGVVATANKDMLSKGVAAPPAGAEGGEGGGEGKGKKGDGKVERATQLLLILKWGGELTNLGQRQAIELGNSFRTIMYPDSGTGGLLRLHRYSRDVSHAGFGLGVSG